MANQAKADANGSCFQWTDHGVKVWVTNSDEKAASISCLLRMQVTVYTMISPSLSESSFSREEVVLRLKFGHRSKDCENRKVCDTCEKMQSTRLHDNHIKEERPDRKEDGTARTSSEATSKRVIQNVKDSHTSTIIPVWLSMTSEPDR